MSESENTQETKNKLQDSELNIAIIGRPNVGKSSLINRLLNRNISIVHDLAGTTRDIVEAELDKSKSEFVDNLNTKSLDSKVLNNS